MNYDKYMQKALRGVVRDILQEIAENGVQGKSHYFITFQTDRKDVIIPDFVRARYPEEITIVLQHQFDNLILDEEKIQVDLAFGGVTSTIVIPYTALKSFTDPAADFGLIFTPERETEISTTQGTETLTKEHASDSATVIDLSRWRKK